MITSHQNFDLTGSNTFAMHVKCGCYMEYDSADDIPFLLSSIRKDMDVIHIGAGSNLLFTADFPGVVLHSAVRYVKELSRDSESVTLEAGAGITMDDFIAATCRQGLWGLENLSGIPGEVGSSAVQNVGAYGREAADVIVAVNAYDREADSFVTIPAEKCDYAYRDSLFKPREGERGRYIIHSVVYRLSTVPRPEVSYPALRERFPEPPSSPSEVREAVIAIRDSKLPDPAKVPSAGSIFKNPVVTASQLAHIKAVADGERVPSFETDGGYKVPAAWLIDRCGWKGRREGNVGVWHLQPLVIVNPERRATPSEVIELENKITASVMERFGVSLTPEVEHI